MAWYKTGSISIQSGQTSVSAAGTRFAANSRVGDGLRGPDGEWYEIVNIASETVLGIFPAYKGATVSNSTDWMIAPLQGYNKESADRLRAITDGLADISQEVEDAKNAADLAKQSEINAKTSETNTSNSATAAAVSASNANTSKLAAETAATGSNTAKVASEKARDDAQAAAATVVQSFSDKGNIDLSGGVFPAKPATSSLWKVNVGGTVSGTIYGVNDVLVYSKTIDSFYKLGSSGQAGGVTSVNSRTGDVVLTKSDVELANVDNTSDSNKPVSTAQLSALNNKVDKVSGKQLSTEDFTTTEKTKLSGIEVGATKNQTDVNLLNRANHTGSQLAATISDLASTVRLVTLSGLSLSNASITSSDTILSALGKVQGQINNKAASGSNSDITSLSSLTTPLSVAQGGNGGTVALGITNADTTLNNGHYSTPSAGWVGSPISTGSDAKNDGYLTIDNYNSSYAYMTWRSVDPTVAPVHRWKVGTTWGAWKEMGGSGSGLPVGSIMPWGSTARGGLPAGWIARDGQILNRADWPDLWALVSANAVTDAVWLAAPYTSRGGFSQGNGTTTFRMPDTNGKHPDGNTISAMILRGDGKNSAGVVGRHQTDQLQGVKLATPTVVSTTTTRPTQLDAEFSMPVDKVYTQALTGAAFATGYVATTGRYVTDGVNGSPRIGSETRGSSETVIMCTVGAGLAVNPGTVDVVALASTVSNQSAQIASKVDVNSPLIPRALLVYDGVNGTVLRSQGIASVTRISAGDYRLTLSSAASNAFLSVSGTSARVSSAGNNAAFVSIHRSEMPTTTTVRFATQDNSGGPIDCQYICLTIW